MKKAWIEDRNASEFPVLIGTSGYSYPDWRLIFYPRGLPETGYLEYYSRYFNAIEINYTFYKTPESRHFKTMIDRLYKPIIFSVKVHQSITHDEAGLADLRSFLTALEPLKANGLLGSLLFQFPFRFKNTEENWQRIEAMAGECNGFQGVMEFRHSSWIETATIERLESLNLGLCSVDEPDLDGLIRPRLHLVSSMAYIRFHGRNASKWWNHDQAWERYDYSYSSEELMPWVQAVRSVQGSKPNIMAFFNNHYQGQAVQSAQLFMAFLAE